MRLTGRSAPMVTDLSLEELEREARQVIGEMAYAYYSGGADDERLLDGERGGVGALAAPPPGPGGDGVGVDGDDRARVDGGVAGGRSPRRRSRGWRTPRARWRRPGGRRRPGRC